MRGAHSSPSNTGKSTLAAALLKLPAVQSEAVSFPAAGGFKQITWREKEEAETNIS